MSFHCHGRRDAGACLGLGPVEADPRRKIGLRGGMPIGFGKFANDLPFNGIRVFCRLDADSGVGLTIERPSFDFEQSRSVLGIVCDRFEAGPNLSRHIANWKVTDAVSGRPARVSDRTTTGPSGSADGRC